MARVDQVLARAFPRVETRSTATPSSLTAMGLGRGSSSATWAGEPVTYDTAQSHAAVFACVDLLVRVVCWEMPAVAVRAAAPGAPAVPSVLIDDPSPDPQILAQHWRASALESAILRGYAAGVVTRASGSGWPEKVSIVHPDEVSARMTDGRLVWLLAGKPRELWQAGGDLMVVPSMHVPPGGHVGMSVISAARQHLGLGIAAQRYGAQFFAGGGHPTSLLVAPRDVGIVTQDQAQAFKDAFLRATASREPAVLWGGVEHRSVQISPEDGQMLETINANFSQVCSWFGVPPELVGGTTGDSMTYANVEGSNLRLFSTTVLAWINWFESWLGRMLPRPQSVRIDPDALLRVGITQRYESWQTALTAGFLTVDEVREREDLPPLGSSGLASPSELARILQQIYLLVGSVITSDEAREILNRTGAGLDVPGPLSVKVA